MPRFFVPTENFEQGSVKIFGDDAWHIARSLRMAEGESITVCDLDGGVHSCTLVKITDECVVARIDSSDRANTESPVRITLYQALPKGDKMDTVVQKAVEMGACEIVPFISERCVSRPDAKSLEKKIARWQRIALEAAKQCGRAVIPKISAAMTFSEMLADASKKAIRCFCYEGEDALSLKDVLSGASGDDLALVIGSEGGFSKDEAKRAAEVLSSVGLGKRILRCESASAFALAAIAYHFEL